MGNAGNGQGKKRKHPAKGDHGYYSWEKKRRAGIVILLYGICLLIFFSGIAVSRTRNNVFTVIAVVGVLPAAKWTVNLIMVLLQKQPDEEAYRLTEEIAGNLTRGYELCVTAEEGRLSLDAVVVCGNSVAAYTSSSKGLFEFMQTHMEKIIHGNGFSGVKVRIFLDRKQYTARISALAADPEKYRQDLRNAADAVHEGETRDDAVLRIIRDISI